MLNIKQSLRKRTCLNLHYKKIDHKLIKECKRGRLKRKRLCDFKILYLNIVESRYIITNKTW